MGRTARLYLTLLILAAAGLFAWWLARWDARAVAALLDHLDAQYRGERYRASPELRQRAWSAALDDALSA